jgi:hypothetical protein
LSKADKDRIRAIDSPKEFFMNEDKEKPEKDELTDDEIWDLVPGMGPFIFEKALQDSIPFLTPF